MLNSHVPMSCCWPPRNRSESVWIENYNLDGDISSSTQPHCTAKTWRRTKKEKCSTDSFFCLKKMSFLSRDTHQRCLHTSGFRGAEPDWQWRAEVSCLRRHTLHLRSFQNNLPELFALWSVLLHMFVFLLSPLWLCHAETDAGPSSGDSHSTKAHTGKGSQKTIKDFWRFSVWKDSSSLAAVPAKFLVIPLVPFGSS